jgi:tetrahydromethanopterin S-methyltransferase subunit G
MTDQYRIIGQLEASVESQGERLDRIEAKLDLLTEYVQQDRGGKKIIWAIATAGGVIGVSVMKLGSMLITAIRGAP